ncbi:MAG TPA: SctK family type III secretion system sorting platform protein [Herbaspirillum sp.]|nr:SctK family type III secretion system sorting platform protein [Herbaspirillum sp.]
MSESVLHPLALSGLPQCRRYAALIAFNRCPSRYLHPSWHTEFAAADLARYLCDGAYAHTLLSDFILEKTGLIDISDADMQHPAVQIGMHLNARELQALAYRLALILLGQPIRSAISKASVAAWHAALGGSLHHFACKHAPLLGGAHYRELPAWQVASICPENITEQALAIGFQFLNIGSHVLDPAIGQRLRFKLPREIAQQENLTIDTDHYLEVWTWIYRVWNSTPMRASPSCIPVLAACR